MAQSVQLIFRLLNFFKRINQTAQPIPVNAKPKLCSISLDVVLFCDSSLENATGQYETN